MVVEHHLRMMRTTTTSPLIVENRPCAPQPRRSPLEGADARGLDFPTLSELDFGDDSPFELRRTLIL